MDVLCVLEQVIVGTHQACVDRSVDFGLVFAEVTGDSWTVREGVFRMGEPSFGCDAQGFFLQSEIALQQELAYAGIVDVLNSHMTSFVRMTRFPACARIPTLGH